MCNNCIVRGCTNRCCVSIIRQKTKKILRDINRNKTRLCPQHRETLFDNSPVMRSHWLRCKEYLGVLEFLILLAINRNMTIVLISIQNKILQLIRHFFKLAPRVNPPYPKSTLQAANVLFTIYEIPHRTHEIRIDHLRGYLFRKKHNFTAIKCSMRKSSGGFLREPCFIKTCSHAISSFFFDVSVSTTGAAKRRRFYHRH